jgi:hypothetical protein
VLVAMGERERERERGESISDEGVKSVPWLWR